MTARVIQRWTMTCDECGATITGIASRDEADWFADEHNRALHESPGSEQGGHP